MSFIYRSPKTEVKKSSIEGVGLYAKEDIGKGEVVSLKTGHIVTEEQLKKVEEECGDYWLQVRDNFFLTPLTKKEAKDTALYINHSCDPNVGADGDIGLVTMRDVAKGEELCFDYAMDTTTDYRLECNCGSKLCRKIVTGEDWKRKDLQDRYGMHFSWYILKKIKGW